MNYSLGDSITGNLDQQGKLTITGMGEMDNYDIDSSPLYGNEVITTVEIQEGVRSLGDHMLRGCINVSLVHLSPTVSRIGVASLETEIVDDEPQYGVSKKIIVDVSNPFFESEEGILFSKGKDELIYFGLDNNSYEIPAGVKKIAMGAFSNREQLERITIPESVSYLGPSAFEGCPSLLDVNIPGSVTMIDEDCFRSCYSLQSIGLHEGIRTIGTRAFYGCESLGHIHIPETVNHIDEDAFSFCTSLEWLHLGKNTNILDLMMFDSSEELMKITVSDANPHYASCDGVLFNKDLTDLLLYPPAKNDVVYHIPETVKAIKSNSFSGCMDLEEVFIPESVEVIEANAFYVCDNLREIHFTSRSRITIMQDAFKLCDMLQE